MRTISSKEYALNVEDIIENALADGLYMAFDYITKMYGMEYEERQVRLMHMKEEFLGGYSAEWRDQAIELFERHGMDIQSDGREW